MPEPRPMDELSRGLAIALTGPQRDAALVAFGQQADRWMVALPSIEPLVLDFGLGDFHRVGLIEYWIANESAAGYCGKYLFVFDRQSCPLHRHAVKHETFFVVKGRVSMACGDDVRTMAEGDILTVEPGRYHGFTGRGPALLLELSMPCAIEDNDFADARIRFGRQGQHRVPARNGSSAS